AESVKQAAAEEPYVLAGFSIGEALAHAVAEELERERPAPAVLVLIDTYAPAGEEMGDVLAGVMGQILERDHELVAIDDDGLMAMGAYLRIFTEWEPGAIEAPALLVRASRPLGDETDLP